MLRTVVIAVTIEDEDASIDARDVVTRYIRPAMDDFSLAHVTMDPHWTVVGEFEDVDDHQVMAADRRAARGLSG